MYVLYCRFLFLKFLFHPIMTADVPVSCTFVQYKLWKYVEHIKAKNKNKTRKSLDERDSRLLTLRPNVKHWKDSDYFDLFFDLNGYCYAIKFCCHALTFSTKKKPLRLKVMSYWWDFIWVKSSKTVRVTALPHYYSHGVYSGNTKATTTSNHTFMTARMTHFSW